MSQSKQTRSCRKIGIKHGLKRPGDFLGRDRLLRSRQASELLT